MRFIDQPEAPARAALAGASGWSVLPLPPRLDLILRRLDGVTARRTTSRTILRLEILDRRRQLFLQPLAQLALLLDGVADIRLPLAHVAQKLLLPRQHVL